MVWVGRAGRADGWRVSRADFTKCLEATNGDMASCGYYLEALSVFCEPDHSGSLADGSCRSLPGGSQAFLSGEGERCREGGC